MGKWFKKSSLARSFIPRITVRSLRRVEADRGAWCAELKLTNPLDEAVMVSLSRVGSESNSDADGSRSKALSLLEDDECAVSDTLPDKPFLLRHHDELAEQIGVIAARLQW